MVFLLEPKQQNNFLSALVVEVLFWFPVTENVTKVENLVPER